MADQIAADKFPVVDIYTNPILRKYLRQHLATEFSAENLDFLMAAEQVREGLTSTDPSKAASGFIALYEKHIKPDSDQQINLPSAIVTQCTNCYDILKDPNITDEKRVQALANLKILLATDGNNNASAVKNIQVLIETDSATRFVQSELFKKYKEEYKRAQQISKALEKVAALPDPVTKAILIRGHSFIAAAELIVKNAAAETIDEIPPEDFPLRQELLQHVHKQYRKIIAEKPNPELLELAYINKTNDLKIISEKTNSKLLQDHLHMLATHWLESPSRDVPTQPTQKELEALARGEPAEATKQDLAALEKELVELLQKNVYPGKPTRKFKEVKEELDNAENHICWKIRTTKQCGAAEGIVGDRAEDPIVELTTLQTAEWQSILPGSNQQPKWFTSLPAWEQKYLRERVLAWQNQDKTKPDYKANLGEYLGPVPTTIRRYPGAANAYKTSYTVTGANSTQTFNKVRTGYLVPFDIKDNQEKARIAQQNIEQLLIISIQDYIVRERARLGLTADAALTINMPFLVQTLQSPPFQPDTDKTALIFKGAADNAALFKAIDGVRECLKNPEKYQKYFKELGFEIPAGVTIAKIDVVAANRPVNSVRGLSGFVGFTAHLLRQALTIGGLIPIPGVKDWGRQYRENAHTESKLQEHLQNRIAENKDANRNNPGMQMAQAAIDSYNSQNTWGNTYSLRNLFSTVTKMIGFPTSNAMAEQAALEQIIADKVGVRIGSCVSGKDREEMVTTMALAMTEHFATYGKMPPHANCKKADEKRRAEFVESVAKHFLSQHGQKLAGENAAGCDGLKNVEDVLSRDICNKIRSLAKERNRKAGDPNAPDPILSTDKIAGINKLTDKSVANANPARQQGFGVANVLKEAGLTSAPADPFIVTARRAGPPVMELPDLKDTATPTVELTETEKQALMDRAAARTVVVKSAATGTTPPYAKPRISSSRLDNSGG